MGRKPSITGDGELRTPLSRERVVAEAVALADERGVDALTMRELARRLGVEAASLYNHVSGKDDILDGMSDWIAEQIELPADAEWKEAMRRRASSARALFAAHPWAAALMDSTERNSPVRWAYTDGVLGVLLDAGFSPKLAGNAFFAIDSYVYGFARQVVTMSMEDGLGEADQATVAALSPEAYPNLMRVFAEFMADAPSDDEALFAFGLDLILDGLERLRG